VSLGAADCCIRRDRDSRREFAGPPIPSKHDHVVRRHEPLPKVGAVPITSCRFARRSGHLVTAQTEEWGVRVTVVELKDIQLPDSMQRAMARQAEAERGSRQHFLHAP
jgi:hypothetical protein